MLGAERLELLYWTRWDFRKHKINLRKVPDALHEHLRASSRDFDVLAVLERAVVAVEDARSRPGQGIASTHAFGLARGAIEGVLVRSGAVLYRPAPAAWKSRMGLRGMPKSAAILRAKQWLGSNAPTKTTDLADAALLAVWMAQEMHGVPPRGFE